MKVFLLITAVFAAFCWPSCHAQDYEVLVIQDMLSSMTNAINMLSEQVSTVSEDLKALDAKFSALEGHSESIPSGRSGPIPSLEKCTKFYDFMANTNECTDGSHRCHEFGDCTDNDFGYKCRCADGYTGDGFRCSDIDECWDNLDQCHTKAQCSNTQGSYKCECKGPYKGDGYNCELPCEGYPDAVPIEGLGCVQLTTSRKSWEDARLHCSSLGLRLAEGISREHFRHLWYKFLFSKPSYSGRFLWIWVGAKNQRWQSSNKNIPSGDYQTGDPNGALDDCIYIELDGDQDAREGLADAPCTNTHYSLCQMMPFE